MMGEAATQIGKVKQKLKYPCISNPRLLRISNLRLLRQSSQLLPRSHSGPQVVVSSFDQLRRISDSSQQPLIFPHSASPYVARRKSHEHSGGGVDDDLDSWSHSHHHSPSRPHTPHLPRLPTRGSTPSCLSWPIYFDSDPTNCEIQIPTLLLLVRIQLSSAQTR
ncbi:unnamed protein product [Linum trigynum]|uniref:Uncharacterized protein n=1 Tax=Linum trigynum TaxID=586398 RepID=A0AAV2EQZ8_9ROSI